MKRRIVSIFFLSLSLTISAQDASPLSLLSLNLLPGVGIPLGESSTLFDLGGTLSLSAEYRLPILPWVYLSGGFDYDFDTMPGVPNSISVLAAKFGGGLRLELAPWLTLKGGTSIGYFFGARNDFSVTSYNPCISVGAGVYFPIGQFMLGAGVSYRYLFGLYSGLSASLGLSYELLKSKPGPVKLEQKPPAKVEPLKMTVEAKPSKEKPAVAGVHLGDFSFEDIFPVFHKYYDDHPLGRAVLSNTHDQPITDVKVRFAIPQYMDGPKDCPGPSMLKAGESTTVELFAIFRPSILEVTEATKVQGEVTLEYRLNGELQRQSMMQTIRVLDRNAMTWIDDRRVAAFVTAKDPTVLSFSKNVTGMVKGKTSAAINQNLLQAIVFHGALSLHGLSYVADPKSSYAELSKRKQEVDFLQFPRQTLEYKGGDCDDLSILYCALFESVGIETAFITIPGHIFMAFSLGKTPDDARKAFSYPDELIFRDCKSWIPIEVTERGEFLKAWQTGAKEWRENLARQQTAFYPLSEAWEIYEPVGLPGPGAAMSLPASEKILSLFQEEVAKFIDREVSEKVTALKTRIAKTQNAPNAVNELGVLYARNGLFDLAREEFEKAIANEEYVPALLNLGNIFYLKKQTEKALELYERAYGLAPGNPRVLLGVARASHDLENYFQAKKVYAELKKVDPDLANQFSYLDLRGEEASRAAAIAGVKEIVQWEEE
jgi:tetratricopeptide (TPR) repeat protein